MADKQKEFNTKRFVKLGIIFSLIMVIYIFLQSWSQNGYKVSALTQMPMNMLVILIVTLLLISGILGFIFAGLIVSHEQYWNPNLKNLGKGFIVGLIWAVIDIFGLGFGNNIYNSLVQNTFSFASLLDLIIGTIVGFYLFSSRAPKKGK